MDTTQLIQRCLKNDPAAIETLVQTYQGPMFRLALLVLDDPAEADEAVQDAFISAFRALPGYQGNASLQTWLFAILVNESRTRLRKRTRLARLKERLLALVRLGEPEPAPEKTVMQQQENEHVWNAIQSLGEKHRLPILLRYYHDLPVTEIAQILNLRQGTVHSRLNTARERLRITLRPLKVDDHV